MFKLFKKNVKQDTVVAPGSGQLMPITSVSDAMFSQKIMGDGYAVKPNTDDIVSPVSGTVVSVFPTKHALSLKADNGLEILLHLGVDTVDLKGEPFNITVTDGQHVDAGQSLGTMNRAMIADAGLDDVMIIVFTNMDAIAKMPEFTDSTVSAGSEIGQVTLN